MKTSSAGMTSIGSVRHHNEDSFLCDDELGLFIVCDGVGGHAGGDIASQTAVKTVWEFLREHLPKLKTRPPTESDIPLIEELVISAIQFASKTIYQQSQHDLTLRGMATTLTLLLVVGDLAIMGHVGDSRLYIKRRGSVHQLSHDHTFVNELLRKGALTPEQAEKSEFSHVLTRTVGLYESVEVDTLRFELLPGDLLLLCSDGLSHPLKSEARLEETMSLESLEEMADALITTALQLDGSDNITAVLVSIESEDARRAEDEVRSNQVILQIETLQKMYLFENLNLDELMQVVANIRVRYCDALQQIVREGDPARCLYVILKGSFAVTVEGKHLATLKAGNHFGEMALILKSPRSATVKALEPSQLLILEQSDFLRLIHQEKEIGVKLLWNLSYELTKRLQHSMDLFVHQPT